jgi:type IV pilus assembly protein PilZ
MVDQKLSADKPGGTSSNRLGDRGVVLNGNKPNGAQRPSVVPLIYADKDSLHKAYMPFFKGGGLFIPTSKSYPMNDEMFLLVTLPGSKNPLPVPGKVAWITPPGAADGMKQGIGIEFKGREGNSLKGTIEGILGTLIGSSDPSYTM